MHLCRVDADVTHVIHQHPIEELKLSHVYQCQPSVCLEERWYM